MRGWVLLGIVAATAFAMIVATTRYRDAGGAPTIATPPRTLGPEAIKPTPVRPTETANLPLRRALGEVIVARYAGAYPSASLLARVRRGEVGGVILFADNVPTAAEAAASVRRLQTAAHAGHEPQLLIMVDQEGGLVKRLAGPPNTSAAGMITASRALAEGRATGRLLRRVGITVDLAPVADVAHPSSFLGSRAFGRRAADVARRACAFARGLRGERVVATLKHFPGLGAATTNTDDRPTSIPLGRLALRRDYAAYTRCGHESATMVMISSASYPAAIGSQPAVLSHKTYATELRAAGGGASVTISDDLEAPAIALLRAPARRAITAGVDMLLYARTELASAQAYRRLLIDVRAGRLRAARVRDAASGILALKRDLRDHHQ